MKGLLSLKARIVLCGLLCLGVLTFVCFSQLKIVREPYYDHKDDIVRERINISVTPTRVVRDDIATNWNGINYDTKIVRERYYASWFNYGAVAVLCVLVTVVPRRRNGDAASEPLAHRTPDAGEGRRTGPATS